MADTDQQNNPANPQTEEQTQVVDVYVPKRLNSKGPDQSVLSRFLTYLTTIEEGDRIGVSFSMIFERTQAQELTYTKKSPWEGEYPESHLFHSDIALVYYDLLTNLNLLEDYADKFEELAPESKDSLNTLVEIVRICRGLAGKYQISEAEDKQLTNLLTTATVRGIARFFLAYLAQAEKPEEKTEEEEEKEKEKPVEAAVGAVEPGRAVDTAKVEAKTEAGGGGGEAVEVAPAKPSQEPRPVDVLEIKQKIFSQEVREQVARFTQIGLAQLEIFHKLPIGSLQGSDQLREVLSQKAFAFFTTALSQERFDLLLSSPEERFRFVRQFLWLIQNDVQTTATIENHLYNVVIKNADPVTKQQIEQELIKAEKGQTNTSVLIHNLAEDQTVKNVIQSLQKTGAFPSQQVADKFRQELLRDLQQYLLAAGVSTDKLILAQENILNVLQVWTQIGMSVNILPILDEQQFKEIFGFDIPYNPKLLTDLKEFWIVWRADFAKQTDNILLNVEARYATQEALQLLDKKNTQNLTSREKTKLFQVTISQPTRNQIEAYNRDQTNIQVGTEIADSRDLDSNLKASQQAFLQSTWDSLSDAQRETFSEFYGYEVITTTIPIEFTVHSTFIVGVEPPAFYTQTGGERLGGGYMPDNAIVHSPLTRVRGLHNQLDKIGNLSKLAKRFTSRFAGNKAAEKGLEKIAQTAGSKLPGGPVTGWLAKQAVTKKGRKKLALLGIGGGLSLLIPLQTIGGWLGGALGGAIGFVTGGPLGAAIGGFSGSWIGYGLESGLSGFFKNLFGGGESAAGGGSSIATGGGGAGALLPPAQAATTAGGGGLAAQVVASTGTQAVLATVGIVAAGTIFSNMVVSNALLADFPQVDPIGTLVPGTNKASEYVTIEKRVFITGCPENKCENPAFPVEAEYSITIRSKDNYAITLKEVIDKLQVRHSATAWEEKGKAVPSIPERVRGIADFSQLYEGLIINPGEEFVFSYEETFDENYNDAIILNTFEIKFGYSDTTAEVIGEDSASTGEAAYIGDYSQGAGCWPTTGAITQLPGGRGEVIVDPSKPPSHTNLDAFDIANTEGTRVYTPFAGQLCFGQVHYGYGNHLTLSATEGEFIFAHFRDMVLRSPGSCKSVVAGDFIGWMGTTGWSTGPHLHFGMRNTSHTPSQLGALMPGAFVSGTAGLGTKTLTCYDGPAP